MIAGMTVAMVALPLSLAIASGAGPEKGLVTAIVGGLLISLLGGSRVQIGGPTLTVHEQRVAIFPRQAQFNCQYEQARKL